MKGNDMKAKPGTQSEGLTNNPGVDVLLLEQLDRELKQLRVFDEGAFQSRYAIEPPLRRPAPARRDTGEIPGVVSSNGYR